MLRRLRVTSCALVCAAAFHAPLVAQAPTQAASNGEGTSYDVAFTFQDTTYTGTMKLTFNKDVISGTMTITAPVPVTATVAGTRKDTKLTFDYSYSMGGDQPCDGRVTIDATIDSKTDNASGTARTVGCSDQPLDGTFSMKHPVPRKQHD